MVSCLKGNYRVSWFNGPCSMILCISLKVIVVWSLVLSLLQLGKDISYNVFVKLSSQIHILATCVLAQYDKTTAKSGVAPQ